MKDEAKAYADKLSASGVDAEWHLETGLMHAFCNLGGAIPQGLEAFDRAVEKLREALQ